MIFNVLMATHNGEKFLAQQIESILNQKNVQINILICDDSSSDSSLEIINKFSKDHKNISILQTKNLNHNKTFYELFNSSTKNEPIAFSDQDDIWDHDKLIKMTNYMEISDPVLVITRRRIINENGILTYGKQGSIRPSINNVIVENIAIGNSLVINPAGINLLLKFPFASRKYYDSWIYLIFATFGKIYVTEETLQSYRVHSQNLIGYHKNRTPFRLKKNIQNIREDIEELMRNAYIDENNPNIQYLKKYLSIFSEKKSLIKLFKLINLRVFRQSKIETIFLYLFAWYLF